MKLTTITPIFSTPSKIIQECLDKPKKKLKAYNIGEVNLTVGKKK